jgi:methionine-rich copper-binding protein CopC
MRQRYYSKILALALLCAGLLLGVSWLPLAGHTPAVSAYAFVVGSDPIDGSTISKAPTRVRIYFDAPIAASSQGSVYAFAPGATSGLLVSADQGMINASNPKELDIALLPSNKLPQGGYEVKWAALSLTDGHTTSGLIGFNLGVSNTGTAGTPVLGPSTSNYFPQMTVQGALMVAWDWLVMLALLFWTGILISETLIIPRAVPATFLAQARKHSRSLQALCLAGLLVGEVINLILRATAFTQTLGESGIDPHTLAQFVLNSNYGHFWLARVASAALLFFWWSRGQRKESTSTPGTTNVRASKRFRQLRQQAHPESAQESAGSAPPTIPRSPARVSGAVATNASTTISLPKIVAQNAPVEMPIEQPSPWQSGSWLALAALIMLSLVFSNEIIQLTPLPMSAGLMNWLSLVAQATWFGCIAYLGFTLLPLQPNANPDQRAEMLIRVLKRARPFLLAAIGILLVSELFLNEATIQTPAQLLSDPYGLALLVRDMLLMLMLGATGYTLFLLLPRLQRQAVLLPVVTADMPARRTRTVALERTESTIKRVLQALSGLAALTLICVALMNFFAPPVVFPNVNYAALVNQANVNSTPASQTQTQTQTAGGLTIILAVSPAHVNTPNTVTLTLKDAQSKAVSSATVKLTLNMQIMNMGTANATIKAGNPTYTATFSATQTFTMAGLWLIHVEIDLPGQPAVNTTFQVTAS